MKIARLLLALLLVLGPTSVSAGDYVLIVNKKNPLDKIPRNEARDIYLGKKAFWDSGARVRISTRSKGDVHDDFVRDLVHLSPQQFVTHWKRILFTGTGSVPTDLATDDDVKRWVADHPDGIGYIDRVQLDSSVKPLAVW